MPSFGQRRDLVLQSLAVGVKPGTASRPVVVR